MSARRILTIVGKDLRDVIRDARILVALIVPLGLGLFYGFAFDDETESPSVHLIFYPAAEVELIEALGSATAAAVQLTVTAAGSEDEVRSAIQVGDADIGLVMPNGFVADLASGRPTTLDVVLPESVEVGAQFVASAIAPVVQGLTSTPPPVEIAVQIEPPAVGSAAVIDVIGAKRWSLVGTYVLMIAMIAILVVPIILTEEVEKKTFDALTLIASNADVIIAKLLLGGILVCLTTLLLRLLTRTRPDDPDLFVAGIGLLAISLVMIGLLIAGIFKSANQLNTWSGLLLMPVVVPAFLIGLDIPGRLETALSLLPSGAATRFLQDSFSEHRIHDDLGQSAVVMLVWAAGAGVLLLYRLSRR